MKQRLTCVLPQPPLYRLTCCEYPEFVSCLTSETFFTFFVVTGPVLRENLRTGALKYLSVCICGHGIKRSLISAIGCCHDLKYSHEGRLASALFVYLFFFGKSRKLMKKNGRKKKVAQSEHWWGLTCPEFLKFVSCLTSEILFFPFSLQRGSSPRYPQNE